MKALVIHFMLQNLLRYSNEYAEGDVYFLHQVALHTVQPTHGSSVLTIQIKAAHAAGVPKLHCMRFFPNHSARSLLKRS